MLTYGDPGQQRNLRYNDTTTPHLCLKQRVPWVLVLEKLDMISPNKSNMRWWQLDFRQQIVDGQADRRTGRQTGKYTYGIRWPLQKLCLWQCLTSIRPWLYKSNTWSLSMLYDIKPKTTPVLTGIFNSFPCSNSEIKVLPLLQLKMFIFLYGGPYASGFVP